MKRNLSRTQRDIARLTQSAKDVTNSYLAEQSAKRAIEDYELEISVISKDIDGDMARLYPALRTHHPECLCPTCFSDQDDYEQVATPITRDSDTRNTLATSGLSYEAMRQLPEREQEDMFYCGICGYAHISTYPHQH